jgi:hypothetical protein
VLRIRPLHQIVLNIVNSLRPSMPSYSIVLNHKFIKIFRDLTAQYSVRQFYRMFGDDIYRTDCARLAEVATLIDMHF